MPAIETLEERKEIDTALKRLKEDYSEAYEKLAAFFRKNRRIGYKNITKLMIGEAITTFPLSGRAEGSAS